MNLKKSSYYQHQVLHCVHAIKMMSVFIAVIKL